MLHYVVTGFDERYWNQWGTSWLASLKELAKYDGEILVVSHELSPGTKNRIVDAGGMILPASSEYGDLRADTFAAIAEFANGEPGNYVYWDADVYFQEPISDIFGLIDDQILMTDNPGFLAANHYLWLYIRDSLKLLKMVEGSVTHFTRHLSHYHSFFVKKVADEWNFINLPMLKDVDGKLKTKEYTPKVIHPSGHIKSFLTNRDILFWERYPNLLAKYTETPTRKSSRKLLMRHNEPVPDLGE